jgi:hypothetical protein
MKFNPKTLIKDFIIFSGLGCVAGAGVGFFIFLRLGFPKESQYMIGYIFGLFVVSGLKFGISIWVLRAVASILLQLWIPGFVRVFLSFQEHGLGSWRKSPSSFGETTTRLMP